MIATSLPVIDVAPLIDGSDGLRVAEQIHAACVDTGFFYISGHGVSASLQSDIDSISRTFFARPIEEKMRISMDKGGRAWRGYFRVGDELTSGTPDLKEGIYFGQELGIEDARVKDKIPMHGANLFPEDMPELRRVVLDYMESLTTLGHHLMRGLSLSLGLHEDYFNTHYTEDPLTLFRIFHYPPKEAGQADQWGVGEHTDYGLLTILKQDDNGGLQVKTRSGWIDAPPIAGTFVCNIGDMLDRLTQGYYRSNPHRVLNTSGAGRLSFPFFFDPGFDSGVTPVDMSKVELPTDDKESRWDGASVHEFEGTYGEYILGKVSRVFPELGQTQF